jgi:imidazolonepropionase-like amidohydrolase
MGIQARRNQRDVEKGSAPEPVVPEHDGLKEHPRQSSSMRLLHALCSLSVGLFVWSSLTGNMPAPLAFPFPKEPEPLPPFVLDGMKQCKIINRPTPNPHDNTAKRTHSDRFVAGTRPVWLKNGTVWTGEEDGTEVRYSADVWLDGGVVRRIGSSEEMRELSAAAAEGGADVDEVDLHGAWVTPGIIDLHSHLAVDPAPALRGSDSTNSWKNPVLPYLRSLDGFNTHDAAFNLSIAGGITTMLVLPGSAGNIGGQAFTFKPRWTAENTPQSMQVEPPFVISSSDDGKGSWTRTHAFRHVKHACGENPLRVYGNTRMDSAYDFRRAYTEGKNLKDRQDRWCASPKTQTEPLPESLEWELMADIIRGNVKVNIHCYETVDIQDMVRISNEFQFPIAAFHHAHEAYLVTDLFQQAWGPEKPAVALFANNARYKREAYRGTPYAPKIVSDAGIRLSMKSDHPVLNSRELVYEAAQAHAMGLNFSTALASVTSNSARSMGLGHRIGYVRPGYDADIVVWDSFPLALGATPKQTYIDGIPQVIKPHVVKKPEAAQEITEEGHYEKETAEVIATRGDPDLRPKHRSHNIIFTGVSNLYLPELGDSLKEGEAPGTVIVENGLVKCIGQSCASQHAFLKDVKYDEIHLENGSLSRGLITTGSKVGLLEIAQEEETADGDAYDQVSGGFELLDGLLVHAVDGARFEGKDELMAYHAGVTTAVTSPISDSLISGFSYAFSTAAPHALAANAILNAAAALHLELNNDGTSISSKIALLRNLLQGTEKKHGSDELHAAFKRAAKGDLRIVAHTHSADVIAALIRLKRDAAPKLKLTVLGGHEAWLVADDLASEDVGVVVAPSRPFPATWDQRRILPGPPLSNHTLVSLLASRGVTVGLGIHEECDARLTRYDMAWAYASAPHVFSRQQALDLVSSNLEELLGLNDGDELAAQDRDWVAYDGDMFTLQSRVRAVRPAGADYVHLL